LAAETPTIEPLEIRAGDTVEWVKALEDYPYSDGWRLTYYIVGPSRLAATATADDDDHSITISASQTATLAAGRYSVEGKVAYDGEVFTVYTGSLTVLPDLSNENSTPAGFDTRSHARKVRDALREMMEGTASHPEIAYTIFGERNVQLVPLEIRRKVLSEYEADVRAEEAQERVNRGERANKVLIRFRAP
jgi:hypothetical protein